MTDNQPSAITGSDATDRLIAVYEQLGHTRQDATRLAINLLGAYGREYQREYRPVVLREAVNAVRVLPTPDDCGEMDSYDGAWESGQDAAVAELRRMADAAKTPSI